MVIIVSPEQLTVADDPVRPGRAATATARNDPRRGSFVLFNSRRPELRNMVSRHWLYFGGFVVSGLLLIGAALVGLLKGLSALSGGIPRGETAIVLFVLAAAAE